MNLLVTGEPGYIGSHTCVELIKAGHQPVALDNASNAQAAVRVMVFPYRLAARRPGDIATCFANLERAQRELGWRPERNVAMMCSDTWRWQSRAATPGATRPRPR